MPKRGTITNRRVFFTVKGEPKPDRFNGSSGLSMDCALGRWQGTSSFACGQNQIIGDILMLTENVTCVEFAGTELFIITTANAAANNDGAHNNDCFASQPFNVDVGVNEA
ncbi:hypothetical protein GX50_02243 [[Emmonsia] crescens]|uniref:Uncharacterized protein n=1 Tax=[Emmonsia] crescens TaxID=73230 RepID=A0A2B7ZPF7_9EURO|nr:hypothetical protein GX50_02243 [Emmonsia crescens]